MLAHEQSKCQYLYKAFYETPCGQCVIFLLLFISYMSALYLLFKIHALWLDPDIKIIFPIMLIEFVMISVIILTIIGILGVYKDRLEDPTLSLRSAYKKNDFL